MTAGQYLEILQERRRKNLHSLLQRIQTSQIDMAGQTGIDKTHICGLATGKRPFTEYMARRIEQYAGIGFGYLDLQPTE